MNSFHRPLFIVVTFLLVFLFLHQSCHYFMVQKSTSDFNTTLASFGDAHKHFAVNQGMNLYRLNAISIDSTGIQAIANFSKSGEFLYAEDKSYRYTKTEREILHEVHFYLNNESEPLEEGKVRIPYSDIKEIRILDKDEGKTVASYVGASIAIAGATAGLMTALIIALKSSCPYVYVNNGEVFVFEGEIFGGAIAKNLARDDYLPLPSIIDEDGKYSIRISNELKERQYTDLANLIVVDHPKGSEVLLDKKGNAKLISDPQSVTSAHSYNGQDLTATLKEKDSSIYFFNDVENSENGIIMKFDKPASAGNGKLLLKSKNTLWGDYVFGEFLKSFGSYFDEWMEELAEKPASDALLNGRERNFPLSIYIKDGGQWQMVEYLNTVGPMMFRDFIVPIDLNEIAGDEVEIKIETGFMFWEIDYAAMDFTDDMDLDVSYLLPVSATNATGEDFRSKLDKKDGNFMAQENIGDRTDIVFNVPLMKEDNERSVFLHTHGYYELIRDFEGPPNIAKLNKFKEATYFSEYSRLGYIKTLNWEDNYALTK
ncbi:MAG: hypothetical protein HKN92_00595 [Chitinophagales bacterium]|nr:hypothetical protein [Chitinophagales bacterium]